MCPSSRCPCRSEQMLVCWEGTVTLWPVVLARPELTETVREHGTGLQVIRRWPPAECCPGSPVQADGGGTSKCRDGTPDLGMSHANLVLVLMVSLIQSSLWPVPEHECVVLTGPSLPKPRALTQLPLCSRISSLPSLRSQVALSWPVLSWARPLGPLGSSLLVR